MLLRTSAIALLAVSAVPATAQSISGFTAEAAYTSNDNDDLTGLSASGEYQITPQFGVGGSVGLNSSDDLGDLTSFTARGLYFVAPETAIGLFYSVDDVDGVDSATIGAEVGYSSAFGSFEAYYGVADSDNLSSDADETLGGLSVEFGVGTNIFVSLATDAYDVDNGGAGTRVSSSSIGGRYAFAGGTSVFARYGSTSVEVTNGAATISEESEEFIAIGAQFDFGPTSGAVMSNRSQAAAFGF